jgi:hypothetical protein
MLFGNRRVGPVVDVSRPGWAQAFPFRSIGSGTIATVKLYVDRHNRARRIAVAVYSGSACRPGSMITRGELKRPKRGAWDAVHVQPAPVAAARMYWLVVLGKRGTLSLRDRGGKVCGAMVARRRHMTKLAHAWAAGARMKACGLSAYAQKAALVHAPVGPAPGSGAAPASGAPLGLTGAPLEGLPLSIPFPALPGSPAGYSYQWFDCDAVGRNCSPIVGATGPTYTPRWSDVGHTEYVSVTSGLSMVTSGLSPAVGWQPVSPSAGNLWVSPTGGSCTRSAIPVGFSQSSSCGSLAAAYQAAQCGDVILIESGNYSGTSQLIRDKTALDACTAPVVMTAGPGQSPIFGEIHDGNMLTNTPGGSNLVIYNVALTGASGSTDRITAEDATNVVFEAIHGGAFYVNDAHHVLIENSSFGPCATGTVASGGCHSNSKIDAGGFTAPGHVNTSDLTVRRNTFHDFSCNSSGCHFECIFVSGGTGIMIDSNTFERCQLQTVFIQPATSTANWLNYLTIQNNWIMQDEDSNNNPRQYAIDVGANNGPPANVVVRYNSFDATSGVTNSSGSAGNMQIVGNILPWTGNCVAGASYGYNLFLTGRSTCGVGDRTASSPPYVNASVGAQDFHLRCAGPANGSVAPNSGSYILAYDRDGAWRSVSGPREAGSQAEASCGT